MDTAQLCETQAADSPFDDNLAAVKEIAPHLHARLAAIREPNTALAQTADGGFDLAFRGQGLYGQDPVRHAEEQVRAFCAAPVRHWINEPNPEALEGSTGTYAARLVTCLNDAAIAYDPRHGPQHGHFLIIFGIGLGLHIESLIDWAKPGVVIMIDPNLEFLYQSLHVAPWRRIVERCAAKDISCSLIVDRDPARMNGMVRQIIRGNNPALLDGIYLFTHYPSAILERTKELVRKELFLNLSGLGFFEDELIMSRNGIANLVRDQVAILSEYLPDRNEPVFLIGSGPSVDREFDVIASHAGQAVLFSIGTGLRGLLERGIRPDFHVELENGEVNLEIICATAAEYDFGGITLIASLTVQPGMVDLFDRAILFFREKVSPTQVFGAPYKVLQPAGPTVANAGLIAAVRLGFRDIYLFGVDMGTKMPGKYHAEGSVYGAGIRAEIAMPSNSVPGNFGGEVTGVPIFDWSRHVLANVAHYYRRDLRVYNCSDGAYIDGTIPKVSRVTCLPDALVARDRLQAEVTAGLARCDLGLLRRLWDMRDWRADIGQTWAELEALLAEAALAEEPDMSWVHHLHRLITREEAQNRFLAAFIKGTFTVSTGCACWYDARIVDPQRRPDYRRFAIEEFREMVGSMRNVLWELLDQIEERISAA
jgi:hypothetical protein